YRFAIDKSNAVVAALKLRDEAAAKVEAMKASGASAEDLAQAEKNAMIIADAANAYEGTFVATGRTLAEIINLPPKIFTKLIFVSQLLETSEGPPAENVKAQLAKLIEQGDAATAEYQAKIAPAMASLKELAGDQLAAR
ncbi:MAG: hypothetical protein AAGF46_12440, partial [Pseudomonadota bacterium]